MKNRRFWVTVTPLAVCPLVGLAASGAIQGCSAPDPGEVHIVSHNGVGVGPGGSGPGGDDTSGTGDDGAALGSGDDGGTTTEGGTTTSNLFTGAPAFTQATGTATNKANGNVSHDFAGMTDTSNPFGQNCMDCHGTNGAASKKFAAGGSVVKTGTTPAASVEVVLKNPTTNTFVVTHTDALGNFFVLAAQGPVGAGWFSGVRDGTAADNAAMTDPLQAGASGGGCNAGGTCHGGTQGKIHVP